MRRIGVGGRWLLGLLVSAATLSCMEPPPSCQLAATRFEMAGCRLIDGRSGEILEPAEVAQYCFSWRTSLPESCTDAGDIWARCLGRQGRAQTQEDCACAEEFEAMRACAGG